MKRLLKYIISRRGLLVVNFAIVAFIAIVAVESWELMRDTIHNVDEIGEILDAVGIVLVAWGVALEERATLMNAFGAYKEGCPESEAMIDRECHIYGMAALLLGLFMEVTVELVKVPDAVINTFGIEHVLFGVGVLFMVVAAFLLVRMNFEMWRIARTACQTT
ncbi:MAG: hypothetical protein ABIK45_05340 [Pseudomonadota bacterium]